MSTKMTLTKSMAQNFSGRSQVEAVALAGSRTVEASDEQSDFYFYITAEIFLEERRSIAERLEINDQFGEPGDE
jgi:hypothetical protein